MSALVSDAQNSRDYTGEFTHWDRLRDCGADAMLDEEFLEVILERDRPSGSTETIAREMITQFGSIANVVGASEYQLSEIPGIDRTMISDLRMFRAAMLRTMQTEVSKKPVMETWQKIVSYCKTAMAFEEQEEFRILFLDKRHRLIKDEVHQRGTVDHVPVYVREIVSRAIQLSASMVILVHGRPFGGPAPSQADIAMI